MTCWAHPAASCHEAPAWTITASRTALLQSRKEKAGSVARVPAPEIEQLVLDGVRRHVETIGLPGTAADRDLMERHVDRVIVRPQAVEVRIISSGSTEPARAGGNQPASSEPTTTTLTLPWNAPSFSAIKGIIHEPVSKSAMSAESRDALLAAIARAPGWIKDLRLGRVASRGLRHSSSSGHRRAWHEKHRTNKNSKAS
jgi:site-specific DNA recombinase